MQHTAPTQETQQRLEALSVLELELEYRRLVWELYVLDCAPTYVTLPDEWFVAHASIQAQLESEAFDILMESCRRTRWGIGEQSGSEPPLSIPDF